MRVLIKYIIVLYISNTCILSNITRVQMHMGTLITLSSDSQKAIEDGFNVFHKLDNQLSTYKKNSEVYRYNNNSTTTSLSESTNNLIHDSYKVSKLTGGYFNIHHQGKDTLDFGAIAKGYGVDQVAKLWNTQEVTTGSISASGDIRCIDICYGGIEHPDFSGKQILNFISKKPNLAISTSGNAYKDGHLKDPKTNQSTNTFKSLTLFSYGDNTTLDALTTAISVMPKDKAIKFLGLLKDIGWVIVEQNLKIIVSSNLNSFINILE